MLELLAVIIIVVVAFAMRSQKKIEAASENNPSSPSPARLEKMRSIFSQKWVKIVLGISIVLILYYFLGSMIVSWLSSTTEELDIATVFGSIPWWVWLLGIIAIVMILGRKSDPFGAIIATGMVAIALLVVSFVIFLIADILGWDDLLSEINNPNLAEVCTMRAQERQQDELIRYGPGNYIDEIGREIIVCRNQKVNLKFLTKNGAPITVSIPEHFDRNYGHLMPGENDELRLGQFIGISTPTSIGNGAEGWGVWPKLNKDKNGRTPPFFVQDLDYVVFHVRLAE